MNNEVSRKRFHVFAFLILNFVLSVAFAGCSMPNLESPECAAARDVVKQYYSLAIGGDPMSHPDVLAKLKAMRSPSYSAGPATDGDQFYFSQIQPTSSRVDRCELVSADKVQAEVTVIWRVNEKNSTRKDAVTLVRANNAWLVERIDVGEQPNL